MLQEKDKEFKESLEKLLEHWNITDVAKKLDVARLTIYRWIKEYNILYKNRGKRRKAKRKLLIEIAKGL